MGSHVQQFEQALSEYFGRPTVCLVNGTAALHAAIQACGIGQGDEVLVPSLTYVASFQAVTAAGAFPVACDVDIDTLVLDPRDAEKRITSRTKAIMPVFYGGGVGSINEIYRLASHYNLRVIEDAAHAFGSSYSNQLVGQRGDITCFSFDGIKNITSGEGGCVVSDDSLLIKSIQDLRLLGVEKDTMNRYAGRRSWDFDVTSQGWRYHMSNIMASIGLVQLGRLPELAAKRQAIARLYDDLLSLEPRIQRLRSDYTKVVPHIYVVRIHGEFNRDLIQDRLLQHGIETGIHYKPNHLLSYFQQTPSIPLTNTEFAYPQLLTLPLHIDLSKDDVEFVCNTLVSLINL